jgi:hypothetical protein
LEERAKMELGPKNDAAADLPRLKIVAYKSNEEL